MVGFLELVITTSSTDIQPLATVVTVHRKVALFPIFTVTLLPGKLMFVMAAVPLIILHLPVLPTAGVLAARVNIGFPLQRFWSGPALAYGNEFTVISTSSVAEHPLVVPVTVYFTVPTAWLN